MPWLVVNLCIGGIRAFLGRLLVGLAAIADRRGGLCLSLPSDRLLLFADGLRPPGLSKVEVPRPRTQGGALAPCRLPLVEVVADGRRRHAAFAHGMADLVEPKNHIPCRIEAGHACSLVRVDR